MRRIIRRSILKAVSLLLLGSLCGTTQAAQATHQEPLKLGFFPIISTVALFKRFSPLKDYLATRLGRPVVLETAKDFPTFARRTAERRYDIVVTAPHFAVRAVDSGKYQIRATLLKDVQQLVVVHRDSPIQRVEELAGAAIATPPQKALITMMGVTHMERAGLTGARSPNYRAFVSHNAANEAVLGGQTDAAIASSNIVGKALERGAPLRIISQGLSLPNMATLVATDLPASLAEQVEQALLGMGDDTAGRQALKAMSLPGYRSVRAADYAPARPYAYRSKDGGDDGVR